MDGSGEVVLMTILGGTGTLLGPVIGAGVIKYFENIFSAFNEGICCKLSLSARMAAARLVLVHRLFVGEGWHLTLGALFMLIVIFLPGGLMEGIQRIRLADASRRARSGDSKRRTRTPAE